MTGMRFFHFRVICVAALATLTGLLWGCRRDDAPNISGVYIRNSKGLTDVITLQTNGSFTQSVQTANGTALSVQDKWHINGSNVRFDVLYITYDIETSANIDPIIMHNVDVRIDGQWLIIEPVTGYVFKKTQADSVLPKTK